MQMKRPKKSTIKEQVYQILREMILTQKFQLGEKINIDTLAAELNVSNSPIREALMMLEKQGLVENTPNIGTHIISFSPEAFQELCDSLLIIICGAYDLCLRHGTIGIAIANMRADLQKQKEVIDNTDMQLSTKNALAFDKSIVLATQNSHLISIYEQVEDVFFLMALHSHQRNAEEHRQNIYEHSMILECIEKNDVAGAKQWLLIHYDKHV